MKHFIIHLTALSVVLFLFTSCLSKEHAVPFAVSSQTASTASSSPLESTISESTATALDVEIGGDLVTIMQGEELSTYKVYTVESLPIFSVADAKCTVQMGSETVFYGNVQALSDFCPVNNGIYTYQVILPQEQQYQFEIDLCNPVQITMPTTACQGETLVIRADFANGVKLSAETGLQFTPQFFSDGNSQIALLPIRYTTAPGVYSITIQADASTLHYDLQVEPREFETQHLTMDAGTASETALNAQANAEWTQKIEPLKSISDSQRYWENPFLQPVQGEITTEFGCIRYTNDDPNPTRHSGIDIAANTGTPVLATNNGRVQFADYLKLTGNTIVIEHGFGLKSFHYHMDSLAVKTGDLVEKGQQIGTVGSTGYSTGPHLHFAIAVNQVFVNPWTAFKNGF